MRLAIDFDNTLISYDQLFFDVARLKALVPEELPASKNAVRDHLRARDREDDWTRLQGEVYGAHILGAQPYPGALTTLKELSRQGLSMVIVSHKTRIPYLGERFDLHAAARSWLEGQGFFNPAGLAWREEQVFFELTKEAKVARIKALGCTHCIDDLPEILEMLPQDMEKILFSPTTRKPDAKGSAWKQVSAWDQVPPLLGL